MYLSHMNIYVYANAQSVMAARFAARMPVC